MVEPKGTDREAPGLFDARPPRHRPRLVRVHRRGPILRPSCPGRGAEDVFGIDLTAGCGLACVFCHIRGSVLFPGEGRLLFDPSVAEHALDALQRQNQPPRLVVLSPLSDPLPPFREVQEATLRLTRMLLERGLNVLLMTRGRISRNLVNVLAKHREQVRIALGLTTIQHKMARVLEPLCPVPKVRLRGLERLFEAEVPVEVRLEPLIPGLSDVKENIAPLFRELARLGARRVVAHYLFRHPAMIAPLKEALEPFGHAERLVDVFEGGPVFPVGSLGPLKHLPKLARQEGLARLTAWGAEYGLVIETGASQNPDFPKLGSKPIVVSKNPAPAPEPARARPERPSRELQAAPAG